MIIFFFRKGSVIIEFEIYILKPSEISSSEQLTEDEMFALTHEALKGGKLIPLKIKVKGQFDYYWSF